MNEVVKKTANQQVAEQNTNYFTQYGDQASQRTIVGSLLKFTKGRYFAGEDNDAVPLGTRFIANMNAFMVGWIRWEDNKPTDHVMGLLAEGYQPPKRSELGDNDKEEWERDEQNGQPRDPWQFANYLLLKRYDADDDDSIYTFTTSSRGGLNELGALAKKYGKLMRQHENEWPVIEIGSDSYQHKIRSYGMIDTPVFKLVGWAAKDQFVLDDEHDPETGELPLHDNDNRQAANDNHTSGASGNSKTKVPF